MLLRACFAALALALAGCATSAPVTAVVRDPGHPAVRELVALRPGPGAPVLALRYATPANFTRQRLYPSAARAYLHRDAARALAVANRSLAGSGLRLKVLDAYRPLAVQQRMWDLIRDERYVSNPAVNAGRHTRGTAVDVTLVDARGRELPMPTPFDDFTPRAHRGADGVAPGARRNSDTLERAMVRAGFEPYPYEWWHFDHRGWERRPPLDVPLTALP